MGKFTNGEVKLVSPEPKGYFFFCPQSVVRDPRSGDLHSPVLRSNGDTPVVRMCLVDDPGSTWHGWVLYRFTWSADWVSFRRATAADVDALEAARVVPQEYGT